MEQEYILQICLTSTQEQDNKSVRYIIENLRGVEILHSFENIYVICIAPEIYDIFATLCYLGYIDIPYGMIL